MVHSRLWPWDRQRACLECETLRAEVKRLRADVEDIADKVYHWMKRHSARAARETEAATTAGASGAERTADGELHPNPRIAALLRRRQHAHLDHGGP